jgi:hypothetical protein
VFVVCCGDSNGLYEEVITRSEESYWVCVSLCVVNIAQVWRSRSAVGSWATEIKTL